MNVEEEPEEVTCPKCGRPIKKGYYGEYFCKFDNTYVVLE